MNINMLKSKIVLNNETQDELAKALGILRGSLNLKINQRFGFKQNEIKIIMERYNLTPDEVVEIFFK